MAKIVKLAQQIAASEASVQITGESGTGKEVLARFVHGRSAREETVHFGRTARQFPKTCLNQNCSDTA